MSLDRFPKKKCKHCERMGHFPYQCPSRPRKEFKRTPLKKLGRQGLQWIDTRAQWIEDNPPPIEGRYWECYLRIHPWCPVRIDIDNLTLDHVVSRSRDASKRHSADNLRPACGFCNTMKGSQSLEKIRQLGG